MWFVVRVLSSTALVSDSRPVLGSVWLATPPAGGGSGGGVAVVVFGMVWAILGLLCFLMNVRIFFSISVKNSVIILLYIALNLQIDFDRTASLKSVLVYGFLSSVTIKCF